MEPHYRRTHEGDLEIQLRKCALNRWERTALIVIGQGKLLHELQRELRLLPATLEPVLDSLIKRGLISDGRQALPTIPREGIPPQKEAQRYLRYLIGIIENADASRALMLTIALKKAASLEALSELKPMFQESLLNVVGENETQRLLAKLTV